MSYLARKIQTPSLSKYTINLTANARNNPDDYKVIGRDKEIAQVIFNLSRKTKNNPILLGEAGVGKTAIVDGLARLIALNQVGEKLKNKQIRVLQIATLGQQDVVRKMLNIIKECKQTKGRNILFIDEIHTIMGADTSNGAMDLGDVLKPAMARGEIQLIGATTFDEYDKFIEKDPALERRFQRIVVNEPSRDDAVKVLFGIRDNYEKFHHLVYTDEAVEACVDLSLRYIGDRQLPDKAIDLLDQAGSIAATKGQEIIDVKDIALVLQDMKGIPVTNILKNDNSRLKNLDKKLAKVVKGQAEAIKTVTDAVTIAKAGLQDPTKPISSFLFLGTTGVGKTSLTLAMTEVIFDSTDNLIRIDMSEFSERESLDRFQDLLTMQVKRKPYCIILLDEIEKACTAVHDRLLQVLDAGILRDKRGRSTSFKNTIIIMTTNLGAELIVDNQIYEANTAEKFLNLTPNEIARKQDAFKKEVNMELTNIFRPEFVNRIEHKVIFNMLTRDIIKQIAYNNLATLSDRMAVHGFKLLYEDDLIDYLADIGTDVLNGARPLARCIEEEVSAPVAMYIMRLSDDPTNNIHTLKATVVGEKLGGQLQSHLKGSRKVKFTGIIDD
nr:ATP-dependent Clp protease ATP-binding subunit [Ligilactobacillus salivarius]